MRFPPTGSRAGAPIYGNVDYALPKDHTTWLRDADSSTILVAHIETKPGVENFEEIVKTPGLGMVYVGPYDFSISVGHPGDYDHPEVKERMLHVLELCQAHHVPFGTTPSGAEGAGYWAKHGASFFEACDEMTFILQGATELAASWREKISERGMQK